MPNNYYTNPATFIQGDIIRPADVDAEFNALESALDAVEADTNRAITVPTGETMEITENPASRANQVIGFDENGALQLQAGAGIFRGDWTTATLYGLRDIVADAAGALGQDNLYIANVEHTSSTLAGDAANWTLFVDLEQVEAARVAAVAAQVAAELAETNASTSETNASTSEVNSEDSNLESGDWANQTEDVLTRTFVSGVPTNRAAGNYSALHWAAKASADATATASDRVATNQDSIDTAADLVATNQDTIDTAADVVSTNANVVTTGNDAATATTAKNDAQTAQAAAEAAQVAAELAYDNFDDRYLGSFTTASEPTLDNDGAALLDGALYWNTTVPELRVYDLTGVAWVSINNYTHPNHTGDVTSTGDGATVIANNAVTIAKMATMNTDSFLGRDTAGTGNVEVLALSTVRTMLNIEDGATADQTAEEIQDIAGPLVASGGTKTRISVVYDDIANDMDFIVDATNLAQGTRTTTTVPITSSTGASATLNIATGSLAGVMSSADKTKLDAITGTNTGDEVVASASEVNTGTDNVKYISPLALAGSQLQADVTVNNAKVTNVSTNLSNTPAATTVTVESSDGTNTTLPAATTSLAGVLTGADKTLLDAIPAGGTILVDGDIGVGGVQAYDANTAKTDVAQSFTAEQTFKELKGTHYALTGTVVDPANGEAQYKTLTGNTTLTESLVNGQAVLVGVDDGTAYTLTHPTTTWITDGGSAPTLKTTGYTFWVYLKLNSVLYGFRVGDGG